MRGASGEEDFLNERCARASQRCVSAADADDVREMQVMAPRNGGWRRGSNILGCMGWEVRSADIFVMGWLVMLFLRGPRSTVCEVVMGVWDCGIVNAEIVY